MRRAHVKTPVGAVVVAADMAIVAVATVRVALVLADLVGVLVALVDLVGRIVAVATPGVTKNLFCSRNGD